MAPDNTPRKYSQDEVNAILQRALDRQGPAGSISHEDLLETARELGISASDLEAAITEQGTVGAMEAAREEFKLRRKKKFFEHLRAYLLVNGVLMLLDLLTSGGEWFYWPLFGWGIGVAFDAADAFWPKEKDIDRGARRILEKETRRQQQELRQRQKESARSPFKSFVIDSKAGKIIIEKGDKRIEIG